MRAQKRVHWRWIVPTLVITVLGGCKVTEEDIQYWKGTVKGPGKILAVLQSDSYPVELRSEAAMALVEMEPRTKTSTHAAVDGVEVLFEKGIPELEPETRQKVVRKLVPELKKLMKGGDSAQQDDPNAGPPPLQVRGKDAAYLLIQHAQGKPRQELTEAVVGWYVQDFNGRSLAGNYSAEQVVRYLGAPAAKLLVDALNSHMPQVTLVKIAELIGQLGDAETKKAAGKRLVEIEKEMESKKFLDWLSNRIRKELEAQSDEEVDDDRVKAAAVLNREKFINEGALPAMKHLADQKVVADRLVSIASDKKMKIPEVNKKKAEELRTARRKRALLALEGNVTEKHLDEMLTLALSEDNPTAVRDEAFDRIGDIGSKRAIPKLWPLVSGEEQRLRWRAGELVLAIGGNDIVSEFFSKLPEGGDVKYAPEELEGYAQRMSQMNPPPTDIVRRQLRSGSWWDQVLALRFFERKGTEDDISRMKRLTRSDSTPKGPGWEEGATVGKVAKDAIDGLKERFQQPSEG